MTQASHLDQRIEYLEDCKVSAEPWLGWEHQLKLEFRWFQCYGEPLWVPSSKYRRKPRTMNINGHEFPEPLRVAPAVSTAYWVYANSTLKPTAKLFWHGDKYDLEYLSLGMCQATKEGALAQAKAIVLACGGKWEWV